MLKSLIRVSALAIAFACAGCAAKPNEITRAKPVPALNVKGTLALEGYDPVAYFQEGAPTLGKSDIRYEWNGAEWHFLSSEHLDAFKADPTRYAPQFGGYCAYAVSIGKTANGDPQQWAIVDRKLYLNNNALAMALWNRDRPGNIKAGDGNWPLIPKYSLEKNRQ